MKKIIIFSLLLITCLGLFSQTGTIVDKESYVVVNYPNGDTISVGKSQVVSLRISGDEVFVMTSQNWGQDRVTKIASLNYLTFGLANTQELRRYLSLLFFNSYKATYHYTSGSIDTVSYYAGDSLAYKIAFSYDDGSITEKSAPINE